jgi:hypothetical protein
LFAVLIIQTASILPLNCLAGSSTFWTFTALLLATAMGGKTWSLEEEKTFWRFIVPQSPKAAKRCDRLKDWDQCASIMQWKTGKNARRTYTKLMLCMQLAAFSLSHD